MNTIRVVVDRARWLRGDAVGSVLQNNAGHRCCLGFVCLALGLEEKQILSIPDPGRVGLTSSLTREQREALQRLLAPCSCTACESTEGSGGRNNPTVAEMILCNDSDNVDDPEREAKLIELAKELNIDLVFEG